MIEGVVCLKVYLRPVLMGDFTSRFPTNDTDNETSASLNLEFCFAVL